MDFKKDYYSVLGLDDSANSIEIKKAYRTLAKKYHPDVNPGNLEYEEITKGLNEAYGVIGSQENKFVYDQYRKSRKVNPNLQTDPKDIVPRSKNKRSFIKKSIVITEKRIYAVGRLYIKYFAPQDELLTESINDIFFKIHPTESSAIVLEEDLYKGVDPPKNVAEIILNNPSTDLILKNVAVTVISEGRKKVYELDIRHPIILNAIISDVTKHEGISYGTLTGEFYTIFEFREEHESKEPAEECFGETGRKEENFDENNVYNRVEYYNSDCTTFWSPWIATPIKKPSPPEDDNNPPYNSRNPRFAKNSHASNFQTFTRLGCGLIPTVLFVILFLFVLLPMFGLFSWLLIILALFLLLRNSTWFLNFISKIGLLLLALVMFIAVWGIFNDNNGSSQSNVVDDSSEVSNVIKSDNRISKTGNKQNSKDQIITHYRVWNDYAGNKYEGELKIFLSDYQSAQKDHDSMNMQIQSERDWSLIYSTMLQNDRNRIGMVYPLFDSIRNAKKLNRSQFAEMIVSCIQDVPYYIVLPSDCNIMGQEDPFVRNFLDQNPNYCIGNITYGVQSPGEFLGNLKGDCDTRVAMLFEIFNHYNYKVAILGSSQFRHSILGIELPGEGLSMTYNGINYQMWETTSEGFRPGILAPEVSDLNYWNFYLTN